MDPFKTPGAVSWHELSTPDVESAKAYYTKLFGWQLEPMSMGDMTYHVIKIGDDAIGGISPRAQGAASWQDYVTVSDIEATVAGAAAAGGKVQVPVTPIPTVGRFAVVSDPQGGVIAVIQYTEQ